MELDDTTPPAESSAGENTQPFEQTPEAAAPIPAAEKQAPPMNAREQSNFNAQRRINTTNQKLRARINELTREINRLSQSNKPEDFTAHQNLSRERDTYATIVDSAEDDSYNQRATEIFGDAAPQFMELTYKYSDHVNANEPELRSYLQQPLGLQMMATWFTAMENPTLRAQWAAATPYKKGMWLDRAYSLLSKPAAKPANVPAVSGGRETNTKTSTDDFGIALQGALNAFGRK